MRILHVDDDASIRAISKLVLLDLNNNFDIDQACCVDEALKKLSTWKYDAIISDYEMPQKNGLDFLKELRSQKNDIPFVLFTGKGREEVAIQALNLGADGYYNKQGSPETVYGELAHGIKITTQRKKAEEKLKQNNKIINSIVNSTHDAIFAFDSNWVVTYCNETFAKIGGLTQNEMLGKNARVVFANRIGTTLERNLTEALEKKESKTFEWNGLYEPNVWEFNVIPIDGGLTVFAKDITERKKAEQDLKESEEKYKTLFEQAGDYTLILETQATGVPIIFDANSSALQIHGFTREEIIGKPITFLDEKSDDEQVIDRVSKLLNNEKLTFETKHRRKDSSTIDVEVSINKVKVGSKNLLVSVERDITKRKKNEEALGQEQNRLESVTRNIGAGLVIISTDYKILWMNNYLKQLGDASEGSPCYSSFNTCTSICPDCGPKKIFEGADFDRREYCNQVGFNKGHPVWFDLIATPIKDKDGNVVAALELTINITEKKEAEKKLKENSDKIDLMNEKLRVVGSLTRHDVINKLMAARSNLFLLRKRIGDNPDLAKYLDGIGTAIASSDRIFEFSRLYERIGAEKPSKESVFENFNQAVALMTKLGNVEVANECQGLHVIADSLLKQLFYNFIDNSLKHGEKVTQIRLHCTREGKEMKLIYEDNGVGVPETNKPKLFEAGFTTGKGSGLGLYLVKKMMDVYGWTITEEGEPSIGAKFVITIPACAISGPEKETFA